MEQVGKTFYDEFGDKGITKIVTIEASGIAIVDSMTDDGKITFRKQ
jgi:adenine/guanine phosphoribosyltransferase-like PRPP-binding protein